MKGKSYIAENRELAFRTFCEEGGNVEGTLRRLAKEHGLALSKPTFYDWMKRFNFEERRVKVDGEKQKTADSQISFEERMINTLLDQQKTYEDYFKTLSAPDHQAQYAYTGIIKAILDIRTKLGSFKSAMFLDFMKDMITYLSKNDPGSVPVIEKNFDDFIEFARAKYGA